MPVITVVWIVMRDTTTKFKKLLAFACCCFSVTLTLTILHEQEHHAASLREYVPLSSFPVTTEQLDSIIVENAGLSHSDVSITKSKGTSKHYQQSLKRQRQLHTTKNGTIRRPDTSTWKFPILHSNGILQLAVDLEARGEQPKDEESTSVLTVENVEHIMKRHHDTYYSVLSKYHSGGEANTNNGGSGPSLNYTLDMMKKRQQQMGSAYEVQPISRRDFSVLPEGELIVWKGKSKNTLTYSAYDGKRSMVLDREADVNGVTFVPPEVGAAWTQKGGYHKDNIEEHGPKYESDYMSKIDKVTEIEGDHVYWGVYFQGIFAHIMLDYIAYFSYLKDHLPSNAKMLILDSGGGESGNKVRSMFEVIDPTFTNERITFVPCSSRPVLCHDQLIRVKNGNLIVMHPTTYHRHMDYFQSARRWIKESTSDDSSVPRKRNKVIYHTRNPIHALEEALSATDPVSAAKEIQSSVDPKKESGVGNGRVMDLAHDVLLVQILKRAIRRYQFSQHTTATAREEEGERRTLTSNDEPLELVFFDGSMSFQETINLFQSANIVIGPHGGGMANTLLLSDGDEINKVKVLEFITSPLTPNLHEGLLLRSYFYMFNTAPWIDEYHHILYMPPSTDWGKTFINKKGFSDALKSIFQQEPNENDMVQI